MKIATLLLVLLTGAAHATGVEPPKPTPQTAQATQTQTQSAASTANATGGAGGVATGTGGTGGLGGNATAGSANGGQGGSVSGDTALSVAGDASDYKSLGLVLPPTASTPALPAMPNCDADTRQSAVAFGFGLFSQADSRADPSDCTLLKLRHLKQTQCQYASAKQIEDLLIAKLLPGYQPTQNVGIDHTQAGCAALMSPPPPVAPQPVVRTEYETRYIYLDPPVVAHPQATKPVVAHKPKNVIRKKPCPTGQKLVCTKEP